MLTAVIIFIVFTSVVAILWVGSHDVLTGSISPGRLGQFVLYAAFAAAGLGQLSEVWVVSPVASGASERLFEILRAKLRNLRTGLAADHAGTGARRFSGSPLGSKNTSIPPFSLLVNAAACSPSLPRTAITPRFSSHPMYAIW